MTMSPNCTARSGPGCNMCSSAPAVASSLFETGGFWYADPNARSPDIQFHLGLGSGIEAGVARLKNAGVTLNSAYLHPRSRGTVRLSSADPAQAPLIDPNYWEDPHDRKMSLEGLKIAREIMQQPALEPLFWASVCRVPKSRRKSSSSNMAVPMPRRITTRSAPARWERTRWRSSTWS